jgi:putative flavoprotein involved in K+ transport
MVTTISSDDGAVIVIGGGPAGLAAAAALGAEGVPCRVLDRGERTGDSWRYLYDRLRLHTSRAKSGLPGLPIPAEFGRWVMRDDVVAYLEGYARHHQLSIEHGVTAERIEQEDGLLNVGTSAGTRVARWVVVATGYNNVPSIPGWARDGRFAGRVLHTREYRNPTPFRGCRVLVVGSGNSGAEIAQDLAEQGIEVSIAIRTPPSIMPRAIAGVPTQVIGILLRPLPPRLVDPAMAFTNLVMRGNLRRYGMPGPPRHTYSHFLEAGVTPILDVGFVRMLKAGRIKVVPAVEGLDEGGAVLAGGGRVDVDVVLLATGYQRALEPLVGHLGLLDRRGLPMVHGERMHPDVPGLYFIGFTNPISGNFREIAHNAPQIARAIRRAIVNEAAVRTAS